MIWRVNGNDRALTAQSRPLSSYTFLVRFTWIFFSVFGHTLSFLDRVTVKSLNITITLSNFYFPKKLVVAIATTLKF